MLIKETETSLKEKKYVPPWGNMQNWGKETCRNTRHKPGANSREVH